ncbi:hypothetical protein TNCV_2112201 [Trichonephila clavipes]|nr:hypothetical protein TNCV_2112201 [Trichonephila clavipes]
MHVKSVGAQSPSVGMVGLIIFTAFYLCKKLKKKRNFKIKRKLPCNFETRSSDEEDTSDGVSHSHSFDTTPTSGHIGARGKFNVHRSLYTTGLRWQVISPALVVAIWAGVKGHIGNSIEDVLAPQGNTTARVIERDTSGEIYYFLEGSELAKMVAKVTKLAANLTLTPRFRQVLIELPL